MKVADKAKWKSNLAKVSDNVASILNLNTTRDEIGEIKEEIGEIKELLVNNNKFMSFADVVKVNNRKKHVFIKPAQMRPWTR